MAEEAGETTAAETVATTTADTGGQTAAQQTETKAVETAAPAVPEFSYADYVAQKISDPKLKDYASRFKSVDELVDGSLKLRQEMSKRVSVPGKDAKPEDVAAFRKAIGASDEVEAYEASVPAEAGELGEPQKALLSLIQQKAMETGVPVESFKAFTEEYFKTEMAVMAKVKEEVSAFQKSAVADLKKEFGSEYDKRLAAGNNLIDRIDESGGVRAFLNDTIQWNGVAIRAGDHPAILRLVSNLGLRMAEDGVIGYQTSGERQTIQEQINQIRSETPAGTPGHTREVSDKLAALYAKMG